MRRLQNPKTWTSDELRCSQQFECIHARGYRARFDTLLCFLIYFHGRGSSRSWTVAVVRTPAFEILCGATIFAHAKERGHMAATSENFGVDQSHPCPKAPFLHNLHQQHGALADF